MDNIKERFESLISQRDKLNEEIDNLQKECPHHTYFVGLYSWRPGAYDLARICTDCQTILGLPNDDEMNDYDNEMENLPEGEPTGRGTIIYKNIQ